MMKATVKQMAMAAAAVLALNVTAALQPTVSITSAAQRWPWNNKLDITYAVENGNDLEGGTYYKVVFDLTTPSGETVTIDGSKDVLAPVSPGTHTVTYELPSGLSDSNCSLVARIYETPGWYMIVDLTTGDYVFDGLEGSDTSTATPTASNARYNTELYKTERMVLRKVPKTSASEYPGGYRTGHSSASGNTEKYWTTDQDYFIGVFPVTQAQYHKIRTDKPNNCPEKLRAFSPAKWRELRSWEENPLTKLTVKKTNSYFFEGLNGLVGMSGFDLPTELMWEIAVRANTTGKYWWGDSVDTSKMVPFSQNGSSYTYPVGTRASNPWGLFDVAGNATEFCRDDSSRSQLADAPDVFTPAYSSDTGIYYRHRGGSYALTYAACESSSRGTIRDNYASWGNGFRVSWRFGQ